VSSTHYLYAPHVLDLDVCTQVLTELGKPGKILVCPEGHDLSVTEKKLPVGLVSIIRQFLAVEKPTVVYFPAKVSRNLRGA